MGSRGRKGAKRGSSASRSRPSKAEPPKKRKPVSPIPKKHAPAKKRERVDRSSAARRGWETRRRDNPLRWGREAIAKRRQNSKVVDVSAKAIEQEWREIERKAVRQAREAEKAGGVHPEIARKLAPLERLQRQLEEMKQNIRTFNNPKPDKWKMKAYTLLEKFITLRDFGGTSEEIKKAHQKWYKAKTIAREKSPDWPAWMAMIGQVLGLPMHGKFSIDSFVTS